MNVRRGSSEGGPLKRLSEGPRKPAESPPESRRQPIDDETVDYPLSYARYVMNELCGCLTDSQDVITVRSREYLWHIISFLVSLSPGGLSPQPIFDPYGEYLNEQSQKKYLQVQYTHRVSPAMKVLITVVIFAMMLGMSTGKNEKSSIARPLNDFN